MPGPRRYDANHRRLRREWSAIVNTGTVNCTRCGQPITPGTMWDLDHIHGGQAPAHASCNRAAGARTKNAVYGRKRRTTRDW